MGTVNFNKCGGNTNTEGGISKIWPCSKCLKRCSKTRTTFKLFEHVCSKTVGSPYCLFAGQVHLLQNACSKCSKVLGSHFSMFSSLVQLSNNLDVQYVRNVELMLDRTASCHISRLAYSSSCQDVYLSSF